MRRWRVLLLAGILVSASCTKVYYPDGTTPGGGTPANPNSPTPVPVAHRHTISYRVQGTSTHASITYTSSLEGTNTTSSSLPWVAQFETKASSAYLFLSATSETGGTVIVQLFVDDVFLREASSDPLLLGGVATISGTFNLEIQNQ
jgi:hypothetical protein